MININYEPVSANPDEIWIPYRYNNNFRVSNFGRVFDCTGGILCISFRRDGERYLYCNEIHEYIHYAIMRSFNYFPGCETKFVAHKDDNTLCNYLPNLEYVDYYTPMNYDPNRGSNNYRAQYTEEDIIKVCELLQENKYTAHEISDMTGVAEHVVTSIKFGNSWKHISCNYKFNIDAKAHRTIKYPDEIVHKICQMLQDYPYKSIGAIRKELDLPKGFVRQIASRATRTDISDNYTWGDLRERNENFRNEKKKEEAVKLLNNTDMSLREISEKLDLSMNVLYVLNRKLGARKLTPSNQYLIKRQS